MAIALFAHIHLLPKVIHGIDLAFIGCQMAMTSSPCLSQLQRDFLGSSDGDVGHFTLVEPESGLDFSKDWEKCQSRRSSMCLYTCGTLSYFPTFK